MSVRWCVDLFNVALSQDKAGFFLVTTKVRESAMWYALCPRSEHV